MPDKGDDGTQEEIAAAEGCSAQPIKDVISDFPANLPKT
jgi:hypothetical protein